MSVRSRLLSHVLIGTLLIGIPWSAAAQSDDATNLIVAAFQRIAQGSPESFPSGTDALLRTVLAAPVVTPPNMRDFIAVNLDRLNNWSPSVPFVELMLTIDGWHGDAANIPKRPDGYPVAVSQGQNVWTILCKNIDPNLCPSGVYHVLFDGTGTLGFSLKATSFTQINPNLYAVTVDQNASESIQVHLLSSDPNDPVTNIRFVAPGHELTYRSHPYDPRFLRDLSIFPRVRVLNWLLTSTHFGRCQYTPGVRCQVDVSTTWGNPGCEGAGGGSCSASWHHRTQPDSFQSNEETGVSWEQIILLANYTRKSPWITIPLLADDQYIFQLAQMFRDYLDPGLQVTIEVGNEVWNPTFPVQHASEQRGLALGYSLDPYTASLRYYSEQSKRVFNIWRQVFGAQRNRFRGAVNVQLRGDVGALLEVLQFNQNYRSFDVIATNLYFGHAAGNSQFQNAILRMSVPDLIAYGAQDIIFRLLPELGRYITQARAFGLPVVAYEGGQHFVQDHYGRGGHPAIDRLMDLANLHPGMGDLYLLLLGTTRYLGLQEFYFYRMTGDVGAAGRWGLKSSMGLPRTQPGSVKYDALLRAINL